MVGAPPLIQLASLVAFFSPIVEQLNSWEAMNPQISCKMYYLLLDYRTRTVMARLHKLHAEVSPFGALIKLNKHRASLIKVMSLPYNETGYNSTNPPYVDCNRGCDSNLMMLTDACVKDKFSTEIYSGRNLGLKTCLGDLAALLRHRVEKLFPVEQLKSLCNEQKPKQPTGEQIFFIKIVS